MRRPYRGDSIATDESDGIKDENVCVQTFNLKILRSSFN